MRSVLATFVCAALLASSGSAIALDRRVVVHNGGDEPIFNLYGSNQGTSDWEEDILGDDVLMPGSEVRVDFDDASGFCLFDFMARFESGREDTEYGVNVCEVSRFTFR